MESGVNREGRGWRERRGGSVCLDHTPIKGRCSSGMAVRKPG